VTTHSTPHDLAGKTVTLAPASPNAEIHDGVEFTVEDWYDRVTGQSWMFAEGNPTAIKYALRTGFGGGKVPVNDEVVYGKIGNLGHIVHTTELGEVRS
jgi:hypothetical protein